jgi:hypothetical protein
VQARAERQLTYKGKKQEVGEWLPLVAAARQAESLNFAYEAPVRWVGGCDVGVLGLGVWVVMWVGIWVCVMWVLVLGLGFGMSERVFMVLSLPVTNHHTHTTATTTYTQPFSPPPPFPSQLPTTTTPSCTQHLPSGAGGEIRPADRDGEGGARPVDARAGGQGGGGECWGVLSI